MSAIAVHADPCPEIEWPPVSQALEACNCRSSQTIAPLLQSQLSCVKARNALMRVTQARARDRRSFGPWHPPSCEAFPAIRLCRIEHFDGGLLNIHRRMLNPQKDQSGWRIASIGLLN
ncbi:hypothetical protein [Derxia gummosa]|uniref:Uncharacterized protein n=1 Tax=Derxia gummosa DSM 723 TaxID=1121388 RepID=A0A8B6XAT9_9BURK|nr:hypothetical protein [Derxia gummosa]